ncbi:hypothetical protein QU481_03265 [Crenobacter sp. SG2303]|uniref:Pre-toxin TG domain-containing protein n=1 Tax=Crenobacter oryzisoli TaxID=3056844 RepID=A0ABT7XJE9_9NEIS|nr:hypothetical protein [Crenobacter sp. SG2303]MDN0073911.1 hypothetical protein [Crenobacter sp. SG2303]
MDQFEQALAWYRAAPKSWIDSLGSNLEAMGLWIWEVVQGDFNENQTTGQIVTGTVISMIPYVDQICDVRDLVANCRAINRDENNIGAWVALALTLVGLFPVLGSFAKGACKVMFLYFRKAGFDMAGKVANKKAFDAAVSGLNKLLDQPAVRKTLKALRIYNPYRYLAEQVRKVKAKVTVSALLKEFDRLLEVAKAILQRAADWGPASIKRPVQQTIDLILGIRKKANDGLSKALGPLNDTLERLARRLEIEGDKAYRGVVDKTNPHKYAGINNVGEAELIRQHKPKWADITPKVAYRQLEGLPPSASAKFNEGWPNIGKDSSNRALKGKFDTFDASMKAATVQPGETLYRVVDPRSSDNSICWMREAEFKALSSKADWRRRFAVWKHWNGNGEYVTYTVPPGQPLKVWEGRAATQKLDKAEEIKLEGGGVQIVLDPTQLQKEYLSKRKPTGWGYTDDIPGDQDVFVGIPKLTHNWYGN